MSERKDKRRTDKRLDGPERLIVRGIALLTALLLLAQLALHFPAARRLLSSTDRWEGTHYRQQ